MNSCASTEPDQYYSREAFKDIKKVAEAQANPLRQRLAGLSFSPQPNRLFRRKRLLWLLLFSSIHDRREVAPGPFNKK